MVLVLDRSRLVVEALGRLYADKHAMSVVCLRIGSFRPAPENAWQLATWVSPRDLLDLVVRSIEAPGLRFEIFYGVSANRRAKWRDDAQARIGFRPVDDAELHAARLSDAPRDPASPGDFTAGISRPKSSTAMSMPWTEIKGLDTKRYRSRGRC